MKSKILAAGAIVLAACTTTRFEEEERDASFAAFAPATGAARAAPAETPRLPERPDLPALLRLALDHNPRIRAARERALAGGERAAIDGALPDPRLLLGWYETSVQTRVGPQEWSLGIQQPVPFPSKLSAKRRLGETLAERDRLVYERVVRDVVVEVVSSAHELAYLDAATGISSELGALLERYTATAGASGSPLPELFRAETQRAQLENDRVLIAELRAAEAEHLRALLDLPHDVAIGTPVIGAAPSVDASFEELLAVADAHNHELREAGIDVEAAALRTSLARKQRLPDLTIGYTRILTDRLNGASPAGNGDDPNIFTLGVTLPVWAGRNAAEIRRAEALERAAHLDRGQARAMLRSRLARAWYRVGQAERLHRLYHDLLVPRAETAVRTAEDLQAAGKGTLAATLETIAVLHNFRLAAARARADRGQAVAELEALLGQPLEETR